MRIIKYTIKICMIIAVFMLLNNIEVFATNGVVNTDTLKLRKEASTSSTVLELLSINDKVEIMEESGDWYKVKYNNIVGYVSKQYIKADDVVQTNNEPVTENPQVQEPTVQPENNLENQIENEEPGISVIDKEMLVKDDFNLRILPLINADSITKINKNSKCIVISVAGEWAYVRSDNYLGWIITSQLSMQEELTGNIEPNTGDKKDTESDIKNGNEYTQTAAYIKSTSVNLRSESNTNSEVKKSLSQNTEITIIGEENDWYKVKYGDMIGYVLKSLVSDKKVETSSRGTQIDRTGNQDINEEKTEPVVKSSNDVTGKDIVEYAKTYLGFPYKYATAGPNSFDCSGFTSYVYKHFGYTISRSSKAQVNEGVEVQKENLQLGDIIIFLNTSKTAIGHVGIYIGDGQFIHASSSTTGVIISSLSKGSYPARYVTARRIIN